MCGIVGVVRRDGVSEAAVAIMRDALAHRGPDDAGSWRSEAGDVGLAMRRLSIIDLSAAGHQPMTNEDGSIWLVFNGEIYNYAVLRDELIRLGHRFRSHSDAEVIIHGYEEWGEQVVVRFRGMFGFALWDVARRRLVLARDHTGIKPLFYYWDGTTFAFASELKAFWALGGLDRSHDRTAIWDYLTYHYIPAPKTAYQRVRKLRPGHLLVFEGAEPVPVPYWDVDLSEDQSLREPDAVALIQERLEDAVRIGLVADVPVGLFLSGGLDSTSVLACMAPEMREPVRAFAIGFDVAGHSETSFARLAAQTFGAAYKERIVGRESVRELLPRLVRMYDEPYCDTSALPTLRLAELARQDVKVALAGDGGDELFAGYRWHGVWARQQRMRSVPGPVRRGVLAPVGRAWPEGWRGTELKHFLEGMGEDPLAQYARQVELFSPAEKRLLLGPAWADAFAGYDDRWAFRQHWRTDVPAITCAQYVDLKTYLPDFVLTKVDRATMAVGLESRPPLLDPRLIEAAFRTPAAIRFRHAEKKYLLKRAVAGRVPQSIIDRPKKGFGSPMAQWMAEDRGWVESRLLAPGRIASLASLDELGHRGFGNRCWALLVLEEWIAAEGGLQ
jgi:asparagine synthase (glutamine-hydrolysing)